MKRKLLSLFYVFSLCLAVLISAKNANAQRDTSHLNDHDHIHPLFELGLSTAGVWLVDENEFTVGFHTHISTNLSHHLPLIAGLGYEYIVDEHQHHSVGILLGWMPVHELQFSISPGVTTNAGALKFTIHAEASYAFEIGKIHLGPALEYAYSQGDTHVSLGLHVGIPFNTKD